MGCTGVVAVVVSTRSSMSGL